MVKHIKLYLQSSAVLLLLVAAATAFLGYHALHVRFDFTLERLFQSEDGEMEAYRRFQADFGDDGAILYVGFETDNALSPETREMLARISRKIDDLPDVRGVFSVREAMEFAGRFGLPEEVLQQEIRGNPLFRGNLVSEDGRVTCVWVILDPEVRTEARRGALIERIEEILRPEGRRFHMAGLPVIEHEYVKLTKRDIMTFLPLAVGVFLLLLCAYFRNLLGTLLPLLTVGIAVVWTLGVLRLLGVPISVLTSIVPNLILVIGIADSIHVLSRHQEDLRAYPDKREALARTLLTMVGACFLTSVTTAIGFLSLLTTDVPAIREFGWISAAGIMIAYVVSMAFMPAVLDRVPPLRARVLDRFSREFGDRLMNGVAAVNRRGAGWVLAAGAIVVGWSVWGGLQIRRESSWLQDIRSDNPVYQAHAFFQKNLGSIFTVDMRLDGAPGAMKDIETVRRVDAFVKRVSAWRWEDAPETRADGAFAYTDFLREINRARLVTSQMVLNPAGVPEALADPRRRRLPEKPRELEECLKLYDGWSRRYDLLLRLTTEDMSGCRVTVRVENMNTRALEAFAGAAPSLRLSFSGKSWLAKRATDRVIENMLGSLGLAAGLIFLAMAALFRSWKVGLIAMVPNLFPMFVTAGFMGFLDIQLNFSTVTIFSISLGIAVDNTIHYLARLRLEIARDGDHEAAMVRALHGAGRPMIFTTILLILGFGAILTSNFQFTFHFGLLGGFTLLIALMADLFIAPSLFLVLRPKVKRWESFAEKWKRANDRLSKLFGECGKETAKRQEREEER